MTDSETDTDDIGNVHCRQSIMTDEQWETLMTAYEMGYFEVPREASGTEVADELLCSSQTFSERIRMAQRNLFAYIHEYVVEGEYDG